MVLSRLVGEVVVLTLGDVRIDVTVLAVKGNNIRLGFKAPNEVNIQRLEIYREPAEQSESER